jgi:hypothetical protein
MFMAFGYLAVLGTPWGERLASAGDPGDPVVAAPPRYDGIIAGWESYLRYETARRQDIGVQLGLNDTMAWYAGAPTFTPYPPDLESVYAFYPPRATREPVPAPIRAYRGYPNGGYVGLAPVSAYARPGYPGVFERWPLVPGDIWGFPYLKRVKQPLGNITIPTGPNSYIYRPVYAGDLTAKQPPPARPPMAEAPLPEAPCPAPCPEPAPAPAQPPAAPFAPPAPPAPPEPPAAESPSDQPAPVPEAVPAPQPEINGPREF